MSVYYITTSLSVLYTEPVVANFNCMFPLLLFLFLRLIIVVIVYIRHDRNCQYKLCSYCFCAVVVVVSIFVTYDKGNCALNYLLLFYIFVCGNTKAL